MGPTIGIRPQAGLANRIRSLSSAIALAKVLGRELRVHWVRTPDCNCRFNLLFEPSHEFSVVETSSFIRDNGRAQKLLVHLLKGIKFELPHGYNTYFYHSDVQEKLKSHFSFLDLPKQKILIQTDARFFPCVFSQLKPCAEIRIEFESFLEEHLLHPYIGIHIRRADHIKAIQHSPTALFVEKIKEELANNPEIKFFLATDSVDDEFQLKGIFGEAVVTRKKELSRAKASGIQDAFVDMLLLSRASKIYGSYYSSFSEIASEIGGIPLHILQLPSS